MRSYRLSTIAAALVAIPSMAWAWDVQVDGPLCILTHSEGDVAVRLTFDPAVPLYTITLTGPDPWPVAGSFGILFSGEAPNTITTDRHVLSPDRQSLSVSDRGFGNVLNGLARNETATGFSGEAALSVSLDGAAPAVEAFRNCGATPTV